MDDAEHVRVLLDERTALLQAADEALRVLLDERYATQTKALDAAFIAAGRALATALEASDKRFESVNEFRAQLTDQASRFVTRDTLDAKTEGLNARLDSLEQGQQRSGGQAAGVSATKAALYAGIATVATVILVGIAILTFNS